MKQNIKSKKVTNEVSILSLEGRTIVIENGQKAEIHPIAAESFVNYFSQENYTLHNFNDFKAAITHQKKTYGQSSYGYRSLNKLKVDKK